jgi:tryptophan synthase alpha subunit
MSWQDLYGNMGLQLNVATTSPVTVDAQNKTPRLCIKKLRKVSTSPVAVGFGVATPEDAARVSKIADGVIVGSAIVKRIASYQQDPAMVGTDWGQILFLA